MKKVIYGKIIDNLRDSKTKNVVFPKVFSLGQNRLFGLREHLKAFKHNARLRITIETIEEKDYVKAVYGEKRWILLNNICSVITVKK